MGNIFYNIMSKKTFGSYKTAIFMFSNVLYSRYSFEHKSFLPQRENRRPLIKRSNNLSEEQLEEINEAFKLFDTENSGNISPRDLKAAIRALGFEIKKVELKSLLN